MKISKAQKKLKKDVKEFNDYCKRNNIRLYDCNEEKIDEYLQDILGFVKLNVKQSKKVFDQNLKATKYFHPAGLVVNLKFFNIYDDRERTLSSGSINFIGEDLYINSGNIIGGSGGYFCNTKANLLNDKNVNFSTNSGSFLLLLEDIVEQIRLYEKPDGGLEFLFLKKMDLIENEIDIENIKTKKVFQNYIGFLDYNDIVFCTSEKDDIENSIKQKELMSAGFNNIFSIKEWGAETTIGFIGNLNDELRYQTQKLLTKKSKKNILYEDFMIKDQVEFLDICYKLVQKQVNLEDIDPKWFDYQAFGTINFLNYIGGVNKKDNFYEKLFFNIMDLTIEYHGKDILRKNLLCQQDNVSKSTPIQKVMKNKNFDSLSCMEYFINFTLPSDLSVMLPIGMKKDQNGEYPLLYLYIDFLGKGTEYINEVLEDKKEIAACLERFNSVQNILVEQVLQHQCKHILSDFKSQDINSYGYYARDQFQSLVIKKETEKEMDLLGYNKIEPSSKSKRRL